MISQKSPLKGGTPNSLLSFNLDLKASERNSQFNWFHVLAGRVYLCVCVCVCVCVCARVRMRSVISNSCDSMVYSPPGSSVHGTFFPGKNTGAGCHFLLHRIFPTLGLKANFPGLRDWQADSSLLSHLGRVCLQVPKWQVQWKGSQKDTVSWGKVKKGRCEGWQEVTEKVEENGIEPLERLVY